MIRLLLEPRETIRRDPPCPMLILQSNIHSRKLLLKARNGC